MNYDFRKKIVSQAKSLFGDPSRRRHHIQHVRVKAILRAIHLRGLFEHAQRKGPSYETKPFKKLLVKNSKEKKICGKKTCFAKH